MFIRSLAKFENTGGKGKSLVFIDMVETSTKLERDGQSIRIAIVK